MEGEFQQYPFIEYKQELKKNSLWTWPVSFYQNK